MQTFGTSSATPSMGAGGYSSSGKRVFGSRATSGKRRGSHHHASTLSMYRMPPTHAVTLEEFETLAIDRLQLLKAIETARARGVKGAELNDLIIKSADKYVKIRSLADRDRDNTSHFILRLAYCRSEELRRYFLAQECALFRARFEAATRSDHEEFLAAEGLEYRPISAEEKEALASPLLRVFKLANFGKDADLERRLAGMSFYKVPFEEVTELVRRRQVLVRSGWAYVPRDQLLHIVIARFRKSLSQSLVTAMKTLPQVLTDDRIAPLLRNLSKAYAGPDFGARAQAGAGSGDNVRPGQIQPLSKTSFPLCMQELQRALKRDSHLRHGGRMQYGLFLKGIGLSLDDALAFWRQEFSRKMGADKFQKNYAYNIRHNYGKEGKRSDYQPYNCVRIINGTRPGPGEHHGCPFKNFDEANLAKALARMRVSATDIGAIIENVKTRNYQVPIAFASRCTD